MRHARQYTALLLCLLLTLFAGLTACTSTDPSDTTASDTTAPLTEAPTEAPTEDPTEEVTEEVTDAETDPPVDLSADELKTLLAAALEKDTENAALTIKGYIGEEPLVNHTVLQIGNDYVIDADIMGMKTRVIALGEQVYYFVSMDDGETQTELRYVLTPTTEERDELFESIASEGASTGLEEDEVVSGILESTMAGKKYADGTVELTCTELSADLITLLMGEPMEGATLSFSFTLDAEGRMTFMRFVIDLPAELTGDEAVKVTTETLVNYTPDPITAPADADQYAPATYDELFGVSIPEPDAEEAASLGLPLDGDHFVIGGENAAVDPLEQIMFLYIYAPFYADKTFTVFGNVIEDEYDNLVLSLGEDADFTLYFDGIDEPVLGSYVSVTATWTQTVDRGDYVDFDCFTMMVKSCEVLGKATGPNGGELMYVTASSLNVRSSPDSSVSDNKVGLLYNGDMVEVLETNLGNGTWCKITFDCDAGYAYISMNYLSTEKP